MLRQIALSCKKFASRAALSRFTSTTTVSEAHAVENRVDLKFDDKYQHAFHNAWLRDNCRCSECYHDVAEERILDSSSIPLDIQPKSVKVTADKGLEIVWNTTDNHASTYSSDFLAKYAGLEVDNKPKEHAERLWNVADIKRELSSLPRIAYDEVMGSTRGTKAWLEMVDKYGFSIVENVPAGDGRCEEVGRRISIIRNSFWGEGSWDVKDIPDPASLSLTGAALFPHTDLVFSNSQPGVQLLHFKEFTADTMVGGESTIVDGFQVAEKIRREDPEAFDYLSTKDVKHVFSSKASPQWYKYDGPVINLDNDGKVCEIRFNQSLIAPLEGSPEEVEKTHKAVQLFAKETRSKENLLDFRLKAGEMIVFNNIRMLHGRNGYNAKNTKRILEGCYVDHQEFVGRLKKLRDAENTA